MTRRLVVGLLAAVAFLLVAATPANADIDIIPGDCKEAPDPEIPGTGWTSWAVQTPKVTPAPEAFDPAHIYEQGGLAGFTLTTYDLGCAGKGFMTEAFTMILNLGLFWPLFGFALFGGLAALVFNPTGWLAVLDPIITSITGTLGSVLWSPAAPVGILVLFALGALIIKNGWADVRIARSAQAAGFALLTLLALAVVLGWPVKIAHAFDQGQTWVVGQAVNATSGSDSATSADVAMTGQLVATVLWPRWLSEHFPDTRGETAKRWAGPLFETRRLTWHEAQIYRADPKGAGKQIWDSKRQDFERVVGEICDTDPAACSMVKGKNVGSRFGDVGLTWVGAATTLPFPLLALFIAIMSLLMVRFALMAFPAAALFLFPQTQHIVLTPARLVAGALINLLAFVFAYGIVLRVIGAFLDPAAGITGLAATILAAGAALLAWIALRKFRNPAFRIRKWRPGDEITGAYRRTRTRVEQFSYNAIQTAAGAATGGAATAASTAGVVAGMRARGRQEAEQQDTPEPFTRVNDQPTPPPASPEPRTPLEPAAPRRPRELDRANTIYAAGEPSPADNARRVDPVIVDGIAVYDTRTGTVGWEPANEDTRT